MKVLDRRKACVYILTLSSAFNGKRVQEARLKLTTLYPEEVTEDRILIVRNKGRNFLVYVFNDVAKEKTFIIPELYMRNHSRNKTGLFLYETEDYCVETELKDGEVVRSDLTDTPDVDKSRYEDVFTSLGKYRKKDTGRIYSSAYVKKKILRFMLLSSLCFILLFSVIKVNESLTLKERKRLQAEAMLLREEEEKKATLQREVSELKSRYESIRENQNIKIKDALLTISACLKGKGTVRSFDMNNLLFSLDAETDDGILALRAFENDKRIQQIRLTRFSEESRTASFTGEFSETVFSSEPYGMSLSEQKDYYEKLIKEYEEQRIVLSISEYMGMLEKLLRENLCTLVSMAQREDENGAVIDVQFTSSSSSLLSFLENAQNQNDFDIKSFRISNTSGSLSCSAVFVMDEVKTISEKAVGALDEREVDSVFENKKVVQSTTSVYSLVRTPVYSFVGKGRNGVSSFILIKGSDGKIERVFISDNTDTEGSCVQTDSGYTVNLGGQIFEVRL